MAIIIDGKSNITDEKMDFLAQELKRGKIFVLPTSTLYGICVNALNEKAVQKVYEIKKREQKKPLIVLVNSKEMLNNLVINDSPLCEKVIDKFWPGPLTIVFKSKKNIPDIVNAKKDTIAIRMDSCDILNRLLQKANVPIVAPSANISGNANISSISKLEKEVINQVDYVIDIGKIDEVKPSTIVKIDEKINILREGKISKEELERNRLNINE